MPAALVAQFPWWALSDPVITFAISLDRLGLAPCIVGPKPLEFIARRFPGEEIFRRMPVHWSETADEIPVLLERALKGPGANFAVFFDEKSFLAGAQAAANLGARTYLYSTEIPNPCQFDKAEITRAFEVTKARLVIQDIDRLLGYTQATGVVPVDPVFLPNSCLPDASVSDVDYTLEPVTIHGINNDTDDWSRTLVLSGSIQAEHATLETVRAFLRCAAGSKSEWQLLVSGWGGAVLDELRLLIRDQNNVILNTNFMSGTQIRWVYSRCRAGVVSYSNSGYNHRYCGMASGKLFWICRAGKPVVCNDNLSIQRLVDREGIGFNLMQAANLDALEVDEQRDGDTMSGRARAFFERTAMDAAAILKHMFAGNGANHPQRQINEEGA